MGRDTRCLSTVVTRSALATPVSSGGRIFRRPKAATFSRSVSSSAEPVVTYANVAAGSRSPTFEVSSVRPLQRGRGATRPGSGEDFSDGPAALGRGVGPVAPVVQRHLRVDPQAAVHRGDDVGGADRVLLDERRVGVGGAV